MPFFNLDPNPLKVFNYLIENEPGDFDLGDGTFTSRFGFTVDQISSATQLDPRVVHSALDYTAAVGLVRRYDERWMHVMRARRFFGGQRVARVRGPGVVYHHAIEYESTSSRRDVILEVVPCHHKMRIVGGKEIANVRDVVASAASDVDCMCCLVALREYLKRLEWDLEMNPEQILTPEARPKPGSRRGIPEDVRRTVFRRDGGRCVKCGRAELIQFDHIIPVALGGSSTPENLQVLCAKCNREKAANI